MLSKLLKMGLAISCLSATFMVNAGTLFIELTSSGSEDIANRTVHVNSFNDRSYQGQGISDTLGNLQIYNVPAGSFKVFVVDEDGNVIAKYAGELADENSEVQVSVGL